MSSIKFDILPAPEILKNDVECFRIVEYTGEEGLAKPDSLKDLQMLPMPSTFMTSLILFATSKNFLALLPKAFLKRWMTSTTIKRDILMSEHDGFLQV